MKPQVHLDMTQPSPCNTPDVYHTKICTISLHEWISPVDTIHFTDSFKIDKREMP